MPLAQLERVSTRQTSADGGAAERRTALVDHAPAPGALAAALNQSPRSQSLMQLRAALDASPRVEAEAGLQRALDKRKRPGKEPPVQKKSNATGLPDHLKAGVEQLSGLAMDDVRVHYNSAKPAAVQAHAYAQGTDIHVAPGQEQHLPHEAWHVVQQKQGRVKPTLQMKGVAINDDAGLEREADGMGARALTGTVQGDAVANGHEQTSAVDVSRAPYQRKIRTPKSTYDAKDAVENTPQALRDILAANQTYVTHADMALTLHYGLPLPLLSPHRHITGEEHDKSDAAEIKRLWGKLVPIVHEGTLPALKDQPGIKAAGAPASAMNEAETPFVPLEDLSARTIYTIGHLLHLMDRARVALKANKRVSDQDRLKMAQCIGLIIGTWAAFHAAKQDPGWPLTQKRRNAARLEKIQTVMGAKGLLGPLHAVVSFAIGSQAAGPASPAAAEDIEQNGEDIKQGDKDIKQGDEAVAKQVTDESIAKFVNDAKTAENLKLLSALLLELMQDQDSPPTAAVAGGSKKSGWDDAKSRAQILPAPEEYHKYNALREEYMVRTILTQQMPSIAIMGEAHVGQIKKERPDASFKYYDSYKVFQTEITADFTSAATTSSQAPAAPKTPAPTEVVKK